MQATTDLGAEAVVVLTAAELDFLQRGKGRFRRAESEEGTITGRADDDAIGGLGRDGDVALKSLENPDEGLTVVLQQPGRAHDVHECECDVARWKSPHREQHPPDSGEPSTSSPAAGAGTGG